MNINLNKGETVDFTFFPNRGGYSGTHWGELGYQIDNSQSVNKNKFMDSLLWDLIKNGYCEVHREIGEEEYDYYYNENVDGVRVRKSKKHYRIFVRTIWEKKYDYVGY